MKLKEFAVPTMALAAVVLLVGAVAGLLVVRAALASEPPIEPTPSAAALSPTDPTPTAMPAPTPRPTSTPVPPTATPLPPEAKLEPTPLPDKSQGDLELPADQLKKGSGSEMTVSPGQGTVYAYQDGDRTFRVILQEDLVVEKTAAITSDDEVVLRGTGESIVRKQTKHGKDAQPVFRSEWGGGLMTLPGGVLLVLDSTWDDPKVQSFFSENGISPELTSELDFIPNGFFVETQAGFASLELANELADRDGVVLSTPNWWREVEVQ